MASVYTILPFIVYVIVANPATYKAVRGVAGNWVAGADGLATTKGLLLHALVYVALVTMLMRLFVPRTSGFSLSADAQNPFGLRTLVNKRFRMPRSRVRA